MFSKKRISWVLIVTLSLILLAWFSSERYVYLGENNLKYTHHELFVNEKFDLYYRSGKWLYKDKDNQVNYLNAPYICKYDRYNNLLLQSDGRIYILDKKRDVSHQISYFDGEWNMKNEDGEWFSMYEFLD